MHCHNIPSLTCVQFSHGQIGLTTFGLSAPTAKVYEELGFTVANTVAKGKKVRFACKIHKPFAIAKSCDVELFDSLMVVAAAGVLCRRARPRPAAPPILAHWLNSFQITLQILP